MKKYLELTENLYKIGYFLKKSSVKEQIRSKITNNKYQKSKGNS